MPENNLGRYQVIPDRKMVGASIFSASLAPDMDSGTRMDEPKRQKSATTPPIMITYNSAQ